MNIDLETLKKIHKVYDLMTVKNNDEAYDLLGKILQEKQFILSGVSNWVAISDRKPPKEWSNYMVCLENNSIFQANYCRIGTERWLIVGVGEITNENPVLYWMEEPKPPCC